MSLLCSGTPLLFSLSSLADPSPPSSHEIAYVFGQLSSPHSVPSLVTVLKKEDEEDMVRHEAAEALGGIATDDCLPVLEEMANKEGVPRVVRESCEVALDMVRVLFRSLEVLANRPHSQFEYERSGDFQYAAPLQSAIAA